MNLFLSFLGLFTISELSSQVMYDIIPWRNKAPERWELLKERRLNAKVKSITEIKITNINGTFDTMNVYYSEYDESLNNTLTIYYDESKNLPRSKYLNYFDSSNNEIASANYDFQSGQFILDDSTVNTYNKNNKIINSFVYDSNSKLKSYEYSVYDSLLNIIYKEGFFSSKVDLQEIKFTFIIQMVPC